MMTTLRTPLCEILGIERPIIQAPMAGATTVDLVAAVCEPARSAGSATRTPSPMRCNRTRARCALGPQRPFAINLFAAPTPDEPPLEQQRAAIEAVRRHFDRLGLAVPERVPPPYAPDRARQIEAVCDIRPGVLTVHLDDITLDDGRAPSRARRADRRVGHERAGGSSSRGRRRGLHRRPGDGGRRTPRHLPPRPRAGDDRDAGAGATDRAGGAGARGGGRRHHGRRRGGGRPRPRRAGGAGRDGLPALSRERRLGGAPEGDRGHGRRRDDHHAGVLRQAGAGRAESFIDETERAACPLLPFPVQAEADRAASRRQRP